MTRFAPVAAATLFIMLHGCAPSPAVKLSGRSVSVQTVRNIVKANHDLVRSLRGSGTISVETPEVAQSGSFELKLHKPDSVLVNVEGPFGINIGSVLLTRDSFLFYNSLQNQVVSGAVTASNLSRIFKMELTFDELLTLFTGGSFFPEDNGDPESISEEENQYVLVYRADYGRRRYFVDPVSMLIARIQHLDSNGKMFLEERFERIRAVGQVSLPRYIRLTQHTARRTVSVSFSTLDVNPGRTPLVLDIPANAEHIRWKE
jgi:outer membrane lipoprotein-sorting protein